MFFGYVLCVLVYMITQEQIEYYVYGKRKKKKRNRFDQ